MNLLHNSLGDKRRPPPPIPLVAVELDLLPWRVKCGGKYGNAPHGRKAMATIQT